MSELDQVRAVIFDWDDTQVRTYPKLCSLYPNFAQRMGLACPTKEMIRTLMGLSLPEMIKQLWPEAAEVETFQRFLEYSEVVQPCFKPFRYSKGVVLGLKNSYTLGIVSSGPRMAIERSIQKYMRLPLDTFRFIHGADECPKHKPDPKAFDPAFELLYQEGIREQNSVYVGDNVKDYFAARDRGVGFVAVTTGFTSRATFIRAGLPPAQIIPSLSKLPELLSA